MITDYAKKTMSAHARELAVISGVIVAFLCYKLLFLVTRDEEVQQGTPGGNIPTDEEVFKARLRRYDRERTACAVGVAIAVLIYLLLFILASPYSGVFVMAPFALVCRWFYLLAQRRKLLKMGASKSRDSWRCKWEENKRF
jgi:TRAP-type uncharacterized transport system fused permease subunit